MVKRTCGSRAVRAAAKREQILAAAQRCFLEQGYAATSTDAVTAAAGVSKQTLYAYYPSKEALLAAVLHRLVDPTTDTFAAFGPDLEPFDAAALRRLLAALAHRMIGVTMQPDYLALMRVIIAEAPRQPHLAHLYRATVPERGIAAITSLLRRAADHGLVSAPDLDVAARLFGGPLLTYALLDGLFVGDGPPRPPTASQIEAVVDLFLRAVASTCPSQGQPPVKER